MCVLCLESLILTAHDMTWDTHMYSTHAAILEPRSFCLLIKNHSCTAFCSGSACLEHAALLLVSLLVLLSVWFVLGLFLVKANVNVHLHVGYYLHSFFYAWQCLKLGCKHFFFITACMKCAHLLWDKKDFIWIFFFFNILHLFIIYYIGTHDECREKTALIHVHPLPFVNLAFSWVPPSPWKCLPSKNKHIHLWFL